jgi:hypothetical protein
MKLEILLRNESEQLVDAAMASLERAQLTGYLRSSPDENRVRFSRLLSLLERCVTSRNLNPMKDYAQAIAAERFQAGFGLQEVFTAFNVLEEQVWKRVTEVSAAEELPIEFGFDEHGARSGKESLSLTYVSLASKVHTPTLNLTHLFEAP